MHLFFKHFNRYNASESIRASSFYHDNVDRLLVQVLFDFCVQKCQAKQVLRETAHGKLNKNRIMD